MGAGCAGIFAGVFMLIAWFYPIARFTAVGGTWNSFAIFLATVPLAYLVVFVGWSTSYLVIATIFVVIVFL